MLKQQIQANPLMKYIEAGLLSSIVEDVAVQSADYTYATEFKQKLIKQLIGFLAQLKQQVLG